MAVCVELESCQKSINSSNRSSWDSCKVTAYCIRATMPYCTRKMVKYMKDNGLSTISDDGSENSSHQARKLRQLPSSVDPISDTGSSSKSKSSMTMSGSKSKGSKGSTGSKSSMGSRGSRKMTRSGSKGLSMSILAKSRAGTKSMTCSGSKSKNVTGSRKMTHSTSKSMTNSNSSMKKPSSKSYSPHVNSTSTTRMEANLTFDEKKLLYMKSLLKSQVDRLYNMKASMSSNEKEFQNYKIDESSTSGSPHSCIKIVKATHKDFNDYPLVCKIYDGSKVNPSSSLFLKILRHLGKKHPNIVQTWDIFSKGNNVYIIQELAAYGNIQNWVSKNGAISEKDTQEMGRQMFHAMDYMGDMGISHRALRPTHVLVCHKDLRIKLTGFRSAVVYWDPSKEDIIYVPCLALSKRSKEPDFQAPEVYGDPDKEEFDPITADIWSLGACLYFFLTKKYPYDTSRDNPKIEAEIQGNIKSMSSSSKSRELIGKMLSTNANERLPFDKINEHPWLKDS